MNKNVDLVTSLEKLRQSTKATRPAIGPRRVSNSKALELLFAKAPSVVLHRFGTDPKYGRQGIVDVFRAYSMLRLCRLQPYRQ